jgi:hypothetical protein
VVNVFGAMLGGEGETGELLDELVARVGADPVSASRTHLPYRAAKRLLAENGPGEDRPGHVFSKSEFFQHALPADAIAALVESLGEGRAPGESRELDFTPWGGAYNRVRPDATGFVHRDERFLLKHGVVVDADATAAQRDDARRWLARSWASVHPWGSGGVYPNFPDPDLDDPERAYLGANLDRVRRVAASYDPDGFFA